jgi:hypothetical protein
LITSALLAAGCPADDSESTSGDATVAGSSTSDGSSTTQAATTTSTSATSDTSQSSEETSLPPADPYGECLQHECGPLGEAFCQTDLVEPPTISICAPLCPEDLAENCPPPPPPAVVDCANNVIWDGQPMTICMLRCSPTGECPAGMGCFDGSCLWEAG